MFKKNLNIKYSDFLTDIRINAACNLLKETNHSIDEIAAAVGYKDTGTFRQIFKTKIGVTPKAYSKKFGNTAKSEFYSFTMPQADTDSFTAVIFNDLHQRANVFQALLKLFQVIPQLS